MLNVGTFTVSVRRLFEASKKPQCCLRKTVIDFSVQTLPNPVHCITHIIFWNETLVDSTRHVDLIHRN